MFRQMKHQKLFIFMAAIAVAMLVISCGPKAVKPTSEMDDPRHHTNMGIKFLNEGNIGEAQSSFERAIQLNPKFSMAYAGLGIVKAYQNDFKAASGYMDQAWNLAYTTEEKVFAYVGYIRLYTLSKDPGNWLDLAKEKFDFAVQTDSKSALPYYFMGMAYKAALEFEKAEGHVCRCPRSQRRLHCRGQCAMGIDPEDQTGYAGDPDGQENSHRRQDYPCGYRSPLHGRAENRQAL